MTEIIGIIVVLGISMITMFPLKKVAQKVYNETGYNGIKGLPKFLAIIFGLANIFLAIVLCVAIDIHYYGLVAAVLGVFILFIALLILVNRKAGFKYALLLAVLQSISGSIMIFLSLFFHYFGLNFISGMPEILSIDESSHN